MELKNNIKIEVLKSGYKSIRDFAGKHDLSYDSIVYLASGRANSVSIELLLTICGLLSCDIRDLFYIEKEGV